MNYTSHPKTEGLGDGTAKNTKALFVHTTLAAPPSGLPFGLLDQQIWASAPEERGQRKANRPNDKLGLNARNIGTLLIAKNVYFIPYGQDNPVVKPNSLVAHMDKSRMSL